MAPSGLVRARRPGEPVSGHSAPDNSIASGPVPGDSPRSGCHIERCPARGYVGAPALTAERFLPDPLGGRPGAVRYRTGDLARWSRQGTLGYLGRTDRQIKLLGRRIEPAEIEHALAAHLDVAAVTVNVWPVAGSEKLGAHLVPARGAQPLADDLRRHARESLPVHLVPAFVVVVPELPVTVHGKLDRDRLLHPFSQPVEGAS